MAVTKAKKKDIKIVSGILHVHTTSNNTLITLIDQQGNKILGGGTGKVGYKGSKKILKDGQGYGLKEIGIIFKGIGMAREGVFKAINEVGVVDIAYIKEETGIQFGGCKGERPKRN